MQGYNLFVYCGNNPVNRIDISGADSEPIEDADITNDHLDEKENGKSTGTQRTISTGTGTGTPSIGKGFNTYRELKKEIGSPGVGNEWHHIVEQNQIVNSGFEPQQIQNTSNVVSVSQRTHRAISGYYSSIQLFTNGMRVRDWLAGQSFGVQYEFGISVIDMFK